MKSNRNSSSTLLASYCILVDNIDLVSTFFSQVFEGIPHETFQTPIRYTTIHFSGTEAVLLVQKGSCSASQLASFSQSATRQVFLINEDPLKIQRLAVQADGQVSEACNENEDGDNFCIFEGPESITFNIFDPIRGNKIRIHEMVLNAALGDEDREGDQNQNSQSQSSSPSPSPAFTTVKKKKKPTPPPIPTLDSTILSNCSRNYVPCPANSRKPIPFETEFFKGTALLVVKNKPPDAHFNSFFETNKFVQYSTRSNDNMRVCKYMCVILSLSLFLSFLLFLFSFFLGEPSRFRFRENSSVCQLESFIVVLRARIRWSWA